MLKCDLCFYETNCRGNLTRHKNMHKGIYYSCTLCTMTYTFSSSLSRHLTKIHGIDKNYSFYKRKITPQDNVLHLKIHYSCDLCNQRFSFSSSVIRHKRNIHGIDTDHRSYKSRITTQDNVPDIQSESCIIDISSDDEVCMEPLNEDLSTTNSIAVNVEKTPIDNSVGTKTTRFNLRPRNPLGVVRRNEYLRKGYKNHSFSTSKKRCTLRKLHEEYVKVENCQDKRLIWASHASSLSQKLNLELKVIGMLMLDIQTDYSTPIDENLIQMLHQDSLFCVENIQHHTQYYIFVQLIYGLMKIYEINSEDLQSHRKSNWMKNTITILEYFQFTKDTANFMIERMENFI